MTSTAVEKFHAGEVYVTGNLCIILQCKTCDIQFGVYSKFLDHIFGAHFEEWTARGKHKGKSKRKKNTISNKGTLTTTQPIVNEQYVETYEVEEYLVADDYMKCEAIQQILEDEDGNLNCITAVDDINEELTEAAPVVQMSTPKIQKTEVIGRIKPEHIEQVEEYNIYDEDYVTEMQQPGNAKKKEGVSDAEEEMLVEAEEDFTDGTDYIYQEESETTTKKLATYKNGKAEVKSRYNGAQKYKCKICGFEGAGLYNLNGHMQRHSSIKPHTCLQCDKAFHTATELRYHTMRHNNEKPYVCTECGLSFISMGILNKHEKKHRGEKRHQCDRCEKRFYTPSSLRLHYVKHTKERNYTCEICQAKFSRMRTLTTHMKLHKNAQEYECIICHMRFNQKPTLLWHIKTKHGVLRKKDEDDCKIAAIEFDLT